MGEASLTNVGLTLDFVQLVFKIPIAPISNRFVYNKCQGDQV